MANAQFDIFLGEKSALQGYRVRNFVRDSAPLVSSKFSTGKQGQSDLDLLKVDGFDTLAGGMFQRLHQDNQRAARVIGFYNKYDETLYPTPPPVAYTPTAAGYPIAKAESSAYTLASFSYSSAGNAINAIHRYNSDGSGSAITMPGGTTGLPVATTGWITSIALHQGYAFVGFSHETVGTQGAWRYNVAANTWYQVAGAVNQFAVMRNVLYGIDQYGGIYSITNEFAAAPATYALITRIGDSTCPRDVKEFNGALWVAKDEGIFRFDGVSSVKVLELKTAQLHQFNGALYFMSGKWLYRFDGTNVTRVQYIDESFAGFTHNSEYLFLATLTLASSYVTSDKFGSYTSTDYVRRVYAFDGASFTLVNETMATGANPYISNIYYTGTFLFDYHQGNGSYVYNRYNLDSVFLSTAVTAASKIEVTASEFDDGFPSVFKALEFLRLDYYGMQSGDSFTVYYQTYDGQNWSSQLTAGVITNTSLPYIEIVNDAQKLFKRLKVSVIATISAGSTVRLKGVSWSYTLQPRARWRWQANLMAGGASVQDRLGVNLSTSSNELNSTITKSIKQKTPIYLLTPDYSFVKTTINAAATSLVVKGRIPIYTDPYSEYFKIAAKNASGVWEILRVTAVTYNAGNNDTTLTLAERGYLSITAASINADAEVRLCFKTYVTRLLRDAAILDEQAYNEQTTGNSDLQREFLLEITEV